MIKDITLWIVMRGENPDALKPYKAYRHRKTAMKRAERLKTAVAGAKTLFVSVESCMLVDGTQDSNG